MAAPALGVAPQTKCQADTIVCDDGEAFNKSVNVPVAEDLSSGVHKVSAAGGGRSLLWETGEPEKDRGDNLGLGGHLQRGQPNTFQASSRSSLFLSSLHLLLGVFLSLFRFPSFLSPLTAFHLVSGY